MGDLIVKSYSLEHVSLVKDLTDQEIGEDYYNFAELKDIAEKNQATHTNPSFVLMDGQNCVGVRLSLAPGQWESGKGQGLTPTKWGLPREQLAYFQSLFIKPSHQKSGWGKKLSLQSIEVLRSLGAQGVLCHSWVESPGDSSRKYLGSLGFAKVAEHPEYWRNVDYFCPRCGKPCLCTAEEMILRF